MPTQVGRYHARSSRDEDATRASGGTRLAAGSDHDHDVAYRLERPVQCGGSEWIGELQQPDRDPDRLRIRRVTVESKLTQARAAMSRPRLSDLGGLDRHRTSEVEALGEVDSVPLEKHERLGILDPLSDRLAAEALGQAHYRFDQDLVG